MTGTVAGSVRIRMTNAQESEHRTVFGPVRSGTLALGATVTRDRFFTNYQGVRVKGAAEDDKIVLEYKADTATYADNGSDLNIPVTIKNINTNEETETFLTAADFGLTTTDVALAAGAWSIVGTKTVDAQSVIKIGHKTGMNSYTYCSFLYT